MIATKHTRDQATQTVQLAPSTLDPPPTQAVRTPLPAALGVLRGVVCGLFIWILIAALVASLV